MPVFKNRRNIEKKSLWICKKNCIFKNINQFVITSKYLLGRVGWDGILFQKYKNQLCLAENEKFHFIECTMKHFLTAMNNI